MPRDLDLDFEFQDDGMDARPRRPVQQRDAGQGMPQGRPMGGGNARRKKNQTASIIVLAVEIVVFIALIVLFFVLKGKIDDTSSSAATQTESSSEGGQSSGVNVDGEDFTLTCTKVQLTNDADGNPVALIYFTFVNKTDVPLAMSEVYPPYLKQNGMDCSTEVSLLEYPAELGNKDMQISGGQSAECCYAYGLSDLTSPLTLTVHDNYSTFTDIGTTEIPIS